jgi:hypothetical protein
VAKPLAPRTREKQDDIIELSRALRRPVRFDDLTNRCAADRNYATSIEWVADRYRQTNCTATGEPLHPSDDDIEERRSRQPRVAALAGPSMPQAPRTAPMPPPRSPSCDVYTDTSSAVPVPRTRRAEPRIVAEAAYLADRSPHTRG